MARQPQPSNDVKPSVSAEALLKGRSVYMACDFPKEDQQRFKQNVLDMGGTISTDLLTSTYILYSAPLPTKAKEHPSWLKQYHAYIATLEDDDGPRPYLRPYHWLSASLYSSRILKSSEIKDDPLFKHYLPASEPQSRNYRPQRFWISRNIGIRGSETYPQQAVDWCTKQVIFHGGVISETRKAADVLLLEMTGEQSRRFALEARESQLVYEREWLQERVMGLDGVGDEEEGEGEGDVDDLETDEDKARRLRIEELKKAKAKRAKVQSKAADKPYIKPGRNEYTPEDDEHLARYLAVYDPTANAWSSHKFYEDLVLASHQPSLSWAQRHTAESWRERVKKRKANFLPRVTALRDLGLDRRLRTAGERENGLGGAAAAANEEEAGATDLLSRVNGRRPPGPSPMKRKKGAVDEDPFAEDDERERKKQTTASNAPKVVDRIKLKGKKINKFFEEDSDDDEPEAGPSKSGNEKGNGAPPALTVDDIPDSSEDEDTMDDDAGPGMQMDMEGDDGDEGKGDKGTETETETEPETVDGDEAEMQNHLKTVLSAKKQQRKQQREREEVQSQSDVETSSEADGPGVETQAVLGNFMTGITGGIAGMFGFRTGPRTSTATPSAGGSRPPSTIKAKGRGAAQQQQETPTKKGMGVVAEAEAMDEDERQPPTASEASPPPPTRTVNFPKTKPRKSGEFVPGAVEPANNRPGPNEDIKRAIITMARDTGLDFKTCLEEMTAFRAKHGVLNLDVFKKSMLKGKRKVN